MKLIKNIIDCIKRKKEKEMIEKINDYKMLLDIEINILRNNIILKNKIDKDLLNKILNHSRLVGIDNLYDNYYDTFIDIYNITKN